MPAPFLTRRGAFEFLDSCAAIETGRLRVRAPEGHVHDFGVSGPESELRLNDWAAVTALRARGDIGFGESYVAGLWDTHSIEALLTVALLNEGAMRGYARPNLWNRALFRAVDHFSRSNSARGASRNIRAHYEVGNEFFGEWLDPGLTYSSALFAEGDDDLGRAQDRKHDRVLDRITGSERVLELGCGWGGFAERAASRGHALTGVTISPNQKAFADARLDGRAEIALRDYRQTAGRYDAVVSIEMVEAVGVRQWPTYFRALRDRLAEGGRAIIQAITVPDERFARYRDGSDYIRHATFPGATLLSPAVIADQAARAGLCAGTPFAFGRDYAATCRAWAARLDARSGRLIRLGHGERRLRHWRYYLGASAAAFATGRADVAQVEFGHA